MSDRPVILLLFGIGGAIVGSFVAALAMRWPRGERIAAGRSHCDTCGATLRAIELVPVVSFLVQRGRCRRCGGAIDPLHPVVEVAAAAIGIAAAAVTDRSPAALAVAGFGWTLLALAAIDARALWLPDRLTLILALGAIAAIAVGLAPAVEDRAIGGAVGFALLWAIAAGYRRLRGREGLGGGDPKLFGAIGLWLGWRMLPAVAVVACLFGFAWLAMRWTLGAAVRRDTPLPFGTLLAAAAYPALLVMIGAGT